MSERSNWAIAPCVAVGSFVHQHLARGESPNRADSVMIAFAPVKRGGVQMIGIFGPGGSVWEPDPKI
jgi:hypothetical protein